MGRLNIDPTSPALSFRDTQNPRERENNFESFIAKKFEDHNSCAAPGQIHPEPSTKRHRSTRSSSVFGLDWRRGYCRNNPIRKIKIKRRIDSFTFPPNKTPVFIPNSSLSPISLHFYWEISRVIVCVVLLRRVNNYFDKLLSYFK